MAIKLSANYSKKLGLPQYSSHSFSASVEVELTDITQVEAEVQKLYALLQQSVDQEIQHAGFIPGSNGSGNGHGNGRAQPRSNGNGQSQTGVKQLNKMQASQLIDDLLTKAGKPATRQTRWQASEPTNTQAA